MSPFTYILFGLIANFATLALNRFLGERNYRALAPEDKMKVIDQFSRHRSLATYLPIGVFLIMIAVIYAFPQTLVVALPAGLLAVLLVSVVLQYAVFRRLLDLSLPDDYVRRFRVQSTLVQIGNIVSLGLVAYGVVATFI
jgi:hypothetical protein